MNARRWSFAGFLGALLMAGFALAMVGSKVESRYGGDLKTISSVRHGLNELRIAIEGATADDLLASRAEAERVIGKVIPDNLGAAIAALERGLEGTEFLLSNLGEEQQTELIAVVGIYRPEDAARIAEKRSILDGDFLAAISSCSSAIQERGKVFLAVLTPDSDAKSVQIERATLTMDLARFEILLGYFTLLVEQSA